MTDTENQAGPIDLLEYIAPRLPRRAMRQAVRHAQRNLHQTLRATAAYHGGLPAEQQSAALLIQASAKQSRLEARQAWASRQDWQPGSSASPDAVSLKMTKE